MKSCCEKAPQFVLPWRLVTFKIWSECCGDMTWTTNTYLVSTSYIPCDIWDTLITIITIESDSGVQCSGQHSQFLRCLNQLWWPNVIIFVTKSPIHHRCKNVISYSSNVINMDHHMFSPIEQLEIITKYYHTFTKYCPQERDHHDEATLPSKPHLQGQVQVCTPGCLCR